MGPSMDSLALALCCQLFLSVCNTHPTGHPGAEGEVERGIRLQELLVNPQLGQAVSGLQHSAQAVSSVSLTLTFCSLTVVLEDLVEGHLFLEAILTLRPDRRPLFGAPMGPGLLLLV